MNIPVVKDKRPNLFERTSCNIWTDPYIQQQMLKEHLNPYSDGATRKQESIQKIIDFILGQVKPSGRLLDLGCGPGLYTTILNKKGFSVTGVDFNKASIEYAFQQDKGVEYILDDYINNYPDGVYDSVMMIYCDLGTHSDNARDILLKNIYQSLSDGGVFIFDVFTEKLVLDKQETKSWEYAPSGGFWSNTPYLLLSQSFHYPENKAFAYQYNLLVENENKHFIVWDRYYSETEITNIIKSIGFGTVAVYKNMLESNNFTSDSEMFVVATK